MSKSRACLICHAEGVAPLIDFGQQALCNRFLKRVDEPEDLFNFTIGQCVKCALVQIMQPVPPKEISPRFDWITYNEQEAHLDDMVEKICHLPGVGSDSTIGAIGFKDDTTIARFQKKGFGKTWRIDPKNDLGIEDHCAGLETVQDRLTPEKARTLADKLGRVDILIVRHILEHAHNTTRFAEALKHLVKPEGYLVFEVPDCEPALTRKDYSMPWEEHIVYFTPETFRHSLSLLGFSEVHYQCYLYSNENSLIAVVQPRTGAAAVDISLEKQKKLAQAYGESFFLYGEKVRQYLTNYRQQQGKIAVFGAGHLSCFWINALGLKDLISFIVDDHPNKKGLFMPGSHLPIRGSASLLEEKVKLCLLSLSPESEVKVVAKNQSFLDQDGSFASMFPAKPNSLPIAS